MQSIKKFTAGVGAALAAMYLLNFGLGAVELIPDIVPGAGNLDEVVATILLFRCLAYLGVDTQKWLGPRSPLAALRGQPESPKRD